MNRFLAKIHINSWRGRGGGVGLCVCGYKVGVLILIFFKLSIVFHFFRPVSTPFPYTLLEQYVTYSLFFPRRC